MAVAGALTGSLSQQLNPGVATPGTAPGPLGLGGSPPPAPGIGWEIFVRSHADYTTLLAQIPSNVYTTFQAVKMLDDIGSGSVTLNQDAPWWKATVLGDGSTTNTILDFECLWQIALDGVVRFEFLGETITEQLTDPSEQRQVTVAGPGTIAALKWAMAAPQGFPAIVLKLDGLLDSFDEVGAGGAGVLDTNIWTTVSPSGDVYITPVAQTYSYPGGAGYALNTLFPSGTLTIAATSGTTLLGSTPWDATDTLISAQITPVGSQGTATDVNGNPIPYGTGLDGSELTQFYVESLKNNSYYALFGLSATEFYCQLVGPSGTSTHIISSAAAYDSTNYAYWMITEQGGTGGGTGTFYFWTSPDGSTWTQQWTVVHNWDATLVGLFIAAKSDQGKTAILSNINSNVTTPSYQGNLYLNESSMGIWTDLLTTAQARGTIPFVTTQLSGTADSFGNAWSDIQNVQVTNGTDLYTMLQSFCSILNSDFCMQPGFNLQVGQQIALGGTAVSLGADRSAQVIFRESHDEMSKQRVRARNAIANLLGVENSDGHEISANSATSIAEWNQREGWFQTSALVDPVSMEIAAAAFTASEDDEVLSWTLSITPLIPGKTVFENFDVGDWVGLERPDWTAVDAVRVTGIAVSVDQDGVETHELTLVSYLQFLQEQFTYISTKLGGGFVSAAGTTPVAPSKYGTGQVPTWFAPAATLANLADVIGTGGHGGSPLVYNAATGQWQSASSVSPVNPSGGAIGTTVTGPGGAVSITDGTVTVSANGVQTAPDGGGAIPAAPAVAITSQSDGAITVIPVNAPPPGIPDTPTVVGGPSSLGVGWDGLLAGAGPLPNFSYVQVHVSSTTGFTPSSGTLQGTLHTGGLLTISGLTPGTTYYAKLVAVNNSAVDSTPSAQASGVPIAAGGAKVTIAATAPGSPAVGDLWFNSSNGYELEQWNGSAWVAYQFGTGSIAAGAITTTLLAGSVTARVLGGITTTIAASAPGSAVAGDIWINSANGYQINQYSGSAWVAVSFTATDVIAAGTINASLITAATITGSLIAAGTITAANIAANTITAAKIAATTITAAQIAANTITAAQIAAGTITATQIAANTITAAKLAAGIVYAGIVDATTVQALQYIATATAGEFLAYGGTPATGNLLTAIAGASGTDSFSNAYPMGLYSQQLTLNDQVSAPAAFSGATVFYSSTAGRPRIATSAGADNVIQRCDVNVAPFTATTVTPSFSVVSATLTYEAGEGNQSSDYEVEIDGSGLWASSPQGMIWALYVDGSLYGNSWPVGIAGATASAGFGYCIAAGISILTSGSGGTALQWSKGRLWANISGNRNPAQSINGGSVFSGVAFDTTVGHTLQIMVTWQAAGSGQTMTTYRTKLTRRM